MTIKEYNKFKLKQREYQLRELPALYILICLLLRIEQLPRKIEFNNYRVPIIKEMKISLKHLESLSQQAILLSKNKINNLEELKSFRYNLEEKARILKGKRENLWRKRSKETNPGIKEKITHEISDLKALIKKVKKISSTAMKLKIGLFCLKINLNLKNQKKLLRKKRKIRKN